MRQQLSGRWVWIVQALSGLLLVVLVGAHWIAQHYVAADGLRTYAEAVAYLRHPLVFSLEVAFLLTVTVHALLGVRAILLDLGWTARWLNWVLVFIGIATFGYGLELSLSLIR
jgi:succinate dehydrogenase hydrophobic anchor subunit